MQPEKAVVFGPIIIFFLVFGALIVGFLFVVVKLMMKGKKSAWKGELIDKLYREKEDFDSGRIERYYTLVFKTEEGKEIKAGTSKEIYDSYNVGDRAEKKSGKFQFEKVA